jgi:hypothetical protein
MRWTFCSNTLTKDIRFGYKPIHESVRRLLTVVERVFVLRDVCEP